MSPVGFESIIPARERPQTHALDGVAAGSAIFLFKARNVSGRYIFFFTDKKINLPKHFVKFRYAEMVPCQNDIVKFHLV
jgi:hypothetical protein